MTTFTVAQDIHMIIDMQPAAGTVVLRQAKNTLQSYSRITSQHSAQLKNQTKIVRIILQSFSSYMGALV